jgi:hypothetical protein
MIVPFAILRNPRYMCMIQFLLKFIQPVTIIDLELEAIAAITFKLNNVGRNIASGPYPKVGEEVSVIYILMPRTEALARQTTLTSNSRSLARGSQSAPSKTAGLVHTFPAGRRASTGAIA